MPAVCAKSYLILPPDLWGKYYYYPHFIDEEAEIQKSFIAGKWHNQNSNWDIYAEGCGPATALLCFSFIRSFIHPFNSELFIHYSVNTDWLPAIWQVLF